MKKSVLVPELFQTEHLLLDISYETWIPRNLKSIKMQAFHSLLLIQNWFESLFPPFSSLFLAPQKNNLNKEFGKKSSQSNTGI